MNVKNFGDSITRKLSRDLAREIDSCKNRAANARRSIKKETVKRVRSLGKKDLRRLFDDE